MHNGDAKHFPLCDDELFYVQKVIVRTTKKISTKAIMKVISYWSPRHFRTPQDLVNEDATEVREKKN